MGAFDSIPNVVVPDDEADPVAASAFRARWRWEKHEVVIMRGSFTAGDQEAVGNASMHVDKKGTPGFSAGTGRIHLLARMIVSWTLSANGRPVPVTLEAIKRLPANYSNPLLEKCDELAAAMSEEEQEDFFGAANGHTPANSQEVSSYLLPS